MLGVRRFLRQIVFLKPDALVVADEVETDQPRSLELRFHPQFPSVTEKPGVYVSKGRKSVLRVETFPTDGVQVTADYMPAKTMLTPAKAEGLDKLEDPNTLYTILVKTEKAHWRNIVVLSWSAAGNEPLRIRSEMRGSDLVFHAPKYDVHLKWDGSRPELLSASK
jgi:hypothetical protein